MAYLKNLRAKYFIAASLCSAIAGCAIHPLPEDVSGASTYDIVERIRCEAREGLLSFNGDDVDAWKIADATFIGFNFLFDIDTLHGVGVTEMRFKKLDPPRILDVKTAASATFERDNKRFFQVIEKLTELVYADCDGKLARRNPVHPITGSIGMGEVIKTYIGIEKLTNLEKQSNVMFTDRLSFVTEFGFDVKPSWEMSAGIASVHLTNLNLIGGSSRADVHSVTITLTRDPLEDVGRADTLERRQKLVSLIKSKSIRDPRTQTALIQKASNAYTRTVVELRRQRDLRDDKREAARALGERMLDILKVP